MFGHLQVYSQYSFQNSTILIDDLCRLAKEKNIQALALTDKNNMYGIVEFYNACLKYGIKPILGMEASVMIDDEIYPFILLAKNNQGYLDLVSIASKIATNEKPFIHLDVLSTIASNLFIVDCLSNGLVRSLVEKQLIDLANNQINIYRSLFQERYILGVQNHALEHQKNINEQVIQLAKEHQVLVCWTNEVRYLFEEEALTLDVLQATTTNHVLDLFYEPLTNQKYLKDEDEIKVLFNESIMLTTQQLMDECNATIEFGKMHLPVYDQSKETDAALYLKELCKLGLKKRLNNTVSIEYIDRLNNELEIIEQMGFSDYFLIVFDYVRFAKKSGIFVGAGRGSAAGSLVAYVLGITNIDPIQYGLFFERFLNVARVSMPDIDTDFQDDRRDEVVRYVIEKYGQGHVSQIITFSSYGPKQSIKDLGKVFGISLVKLEQVCKTLITNDKTKSSIVDSYQNSYAFQSMIHSDVALKKLLNSFILVEKLYKNTSVHASGIVLSQDELSTILPITNGNAGLTTQYSHNFIEDIGLLKMDFLGISNLTTLQQVCTTIQKQIDPSFDINKIALNDQRTFDILAKGDTLGIFQLESKGMTNLIMKMKCNCLDDIVATIALHRPGPMQNIPMYLARKNGEEKITYPIAEMEPILKYTNGIMIYQEQIMQVAQLVAGFSLAKADMLRVAISKKKEKLMLELKEEFIQGGILKGYTKDKVEEVYALIERFADYGFNKSHSVAYGLIAYQLAYVKANYPQIFYSALLTSSQGSVITKEKCIQESRKYGLKILPPSINYSTDQFIVEQDGLRFSLTSIKQVGLAGSNAIIEERKKGLFKDVFDFVVRVDTSKVNKLMIENLIDAGAFDEFGYSRTTLKVNYSLIENHRELASFGIDEPPILENRKDNEVLRLELERNALGIYLSRHPIEIFKEQCTGNYLTTSDFMNHINQSVQSIMIVLSFREHVDKNGNEMCFLTLFDECGQVDGVIFSKEYPLVKHKIKKDGTYVFDGRIQFKEKCSFVVSKLEEINLRE